MPALTVEDQFKFLISCIRHSNNGKIDFAKVAKECEIVSKGAAAKRYERLMKYHGLHQPVSALRETSKSTDPKEDEFAAPNTSVKRLAEDSSQHHSSPNKKARKNVKTVDDESRNSAVDDDEELVLAGAAKIKTEKELPPDVREEPQPGYHGMTSFRYPLVEGARTNGEEYADVLSDFLRPEEFETQNGSDSYAHDGYVH